MGEDAIRAKAKDVIYSLADFFLSHPPDCQWNTDSQLAAQDQCSVDSDIAESLAASAHNLMSKEPTLLELQAPVVVVGDIHGQCCDLVRIFQYTASKSLIQRCDVQPAAKIDLLGHSSESSSAASSSPVDFEDFGPGIKNGHYFFNPQRTCGLSNLKLPCPVAEHVYLFLGDYVDRGCFSCECVLFLIAMKVAYPDRIYLLRGNHESRCMTQREYAEGANFYSDCKMKYGEDVYEMFMKCFDTLPLGAIIQSSLGRWLCCHGGVGSKFTNLDCIRSLDRFHEPPLKGPMCDILWADPLLEEVLGRLSDKDYEEFLELDYLPNPARGCSSFFGYAALSPLLKENDLLGIIRAHQCKEEGIGYSYTDNRQQLFPFPLVTTVFSAANYCGTYTNKGALLILLPDDVQVVKFNCQGETWVEKGPYCPPLPEEEPVEPELTPEEEKAGESKVPEVAMPAVVEPPKDSPTPKRTIKVSFSEEEPFRKRTSLIVDSDRKPSYPFIGRSMSVCHPAPPVAARRRTEMRRKSINLIRKGHTGEHGSQVFRNALQKDAQHEIHPGWETIRRLAGIIGRMQVLRKTKLLQETSPTHSQVASKEDVGPEVLRNGSPESPGNGGVKDQISMSLLSKISMSDTRQIRLLFDSIDANGDEQLSHKELHDFASQIVASSNESDDIAGGVNEILEEMDEDKSGAVSFAEFTNYLARVSSLSEDDSRLISPTTSTANPKECF